MSSAIATATLDNILGDDEPEFMGELNIGGPKLFGGSSIFSTNNAGSANPFDSFVNTSKTPMFKPLQFSTVAPSYQFMNAPQTSLQSPQAGHSTRDQVLGVANRGLDFLTQYFASKGQGGGVQPSTYSVSPTTGEVYQGTGPVPVGAGGAIGSGADSFVSGITGWISQNTGLTIAIAAGIYLWMKQPPGRR